MMDLAQKDLGRAAFQMTWRRLFRLINSKELTGISIKKIY